MKKNKNITNSRLYLIGKILSANIADILEIKTEAYYMANNQNSVNGVNDTKLINKPIEMCEEKLEHKNQVIAKLRWSNFFILK